MTTGTVQLADHPAAAVSRWFWIWSHPLRGDDTEQVVAQGTSPLRADGTFAATFTTGVDERDRDGSEIVYLFRASADVTDEGGETRSDARTFRLGEKAIKAALRMDAGFLVEGSPGAITVTRTDLDGAPRSGAGSWRLVALAEPETTLLPSEEPFPMELSTTAPLTPGDRLRPRWAPACRSDRDPARVARRGRDGARRRDARREGGGADRRFPRCPRARGGCATRRATSSAPSHEGATGLPGRGQADAGAAARGSRRRAALGRGRRDGAVPRILRPARADAATSRCCGDGRVSSRRGRCRDGAAA